MHELRQFKCTKVELSNRGGLNLKNCVIIVSSEPKKPSSGNKKTSKPRGKPQVLRL